MTLFQGNSFQNLWEISSPCTSGSDRPAKYVDCRATSSRTKINVPHILRRWQRPPTSLRGRQPRTVGSNGKNAPLIKPKQSGKLIGHTYDYNNLTDFEMEVHPRTGNGYAFEKLMKTQSEVNLFLEGFRHL